jgi:hypothetical protein
MAEMQVISMAVSLATSAHEEPHVDTAAPLVAAWVQPCFERGPAERLSLMSPDAGGGVE